MQAVILAAGMGKRLGSLTQNSPKCMVKVNGISIIERTLYSLDKLGLNKIVIVTGYKEDVLSRFVSGLKIKTEIEFINNCEYDKTNNVYSFYLAKDVLIKDDTLLLESDIVFSDGLLSRLILSERNNVALVDRYVPTMDGTCVKFDKTGKITEFVSSKDPNFSGKNSSADYAKFDFSKYKSDSLVLTHNHPHSKSFSVDDILTLSQYKQIKTIVATGHDGSVYSLSIDGGERVDRRIEVEYNTYMIEFEKDTDLVLRALSEKYSWRYSKK